MSKIKCVMQDGPKDCGVCCLLMIIHYYGGNSSKEKLREMTNTTTSGVSAYHLLDAAHQLGFQGRGMKGDITKIDRYFLPCIAHVVIDSKCEHFVVIEEINWKRKLLLIQDPAQGKRKMTFEAFSKIATNQYLYLKPKRPLLNITSKNKIIQTLLLNFMKQNKKVFLWITCVSCFHTLIGMIVAFHFKFLNEYVISSGSFDNARRIGILMGGFIIFQLSLDYLKRNLLRILEVNLGYYLMDTIIEQIISLPYSYYKNRPTGEIMSRINDVEQLKEFIIQLFGFLFVDLLCILVMFIFLWKISSTLTLFLLLSVIIVGMLSMLHRYFLKSPLTEVRHNASFLQSSFIETLSGVDTVKGMHLELYFGEKLRTSYIQFLQSMSKTKYLLDKWDNRKEFCFRLNLAFLLWKGSVLVIKQKLSFANFIVFYNFYGYFIQSIQNVFLFLFSWSSNKIVISRLEDLFEVEKENFEITPHRMKGMVGDIWFDHLVYQYQENQDLLNDISLHIKPGEKVCLYGSSGSGKSTLVKLLFRLFPIQKGRILIDGLDIRYYTLENIRSSITYVSQNESVFARTIYQNIVLDKEVSYEAFLEVCQITKVDEIIKDSVLGYDMLVEENGFNLSGGERQRIVLARALLNLSSIYIFDESLNQIDVMMEREILMNMFTYLKDKTVIVISHRYHNQELFDRKFKMENGKSYEHFDMVQG